MTESMRHRGPNGEGYFHGTHAEMGMRRLSIIDVHGSQQPLFSEDRSIAVIANGEIYNYRELRHRLIGLGHEFGTAGDCETIVHAYEQFGLGFVQHLRGMFAIAIYDAGRNRFVLARDRMGEKPLYVYENDNVLVFASEMKGLLRSGCVPFELDPAGVNNFMHYQFVPEPGTVLSNVVKVDAGTVLSLDVPGWRIAQERYWRIDAIEGEAVAAPEDVRASIEEAVKLTLIADVPVGVALSGGLDSSAIAVLAAKNAKAELHAFTVGYPGRPDNDERRDALWLAETLGMVSHEVELSVGDVVRTFGEMNAMRDDPIADYSGPGYLAVARLAGEAGVPVMLQGQGGDELFWGYDWVRRAAVETQAKNDIWNCRCRGWRRLLSALKWIRPPSMALWQLRLWMKGGFGCAECVGVLRRLLSRPEQMVLYDLAPDFTAARRTCRTLFASDFRDRIAACPRPEALFASRRPWGDTGVAMTRLVSESYLQGNGIVQGERFGMGSSVEVRLPLVDHKLVETVIRSRRARPDLDMGPKGLLRQAVGDIVPEAVLRREKKGFAVPVREWHGGLFRAFGESLVDGCLVRAGVLDPDSARILSRGPLVAGCICPPSFKVLVLESWCCRMHALMSGET